MSLAVQLIGKKKLELRIGGPQPVTEYDRERFVLLLQKLKAYEGLLRSQGLHMEEILGPGGIDGALARLDPPPATDRDAVFTFRRLPGNVINQIEGDCSYTGRVDMARAFYEMGKQAMTGWNEQVGDEEDTPIPFDPDFIDALPGTIVRDIGIRCRELVTRPSLPGSNGSSTAIAAALEGGRADSAEPN